MLRDPLHRLRRPCLRALRGQDARQARAARRRAADARLGGARADRLPRAGRGRRAGGDRRAARPSRSSSSRSSRGPRWGSSSRAPPAELPAALIAALSYGPRVLLERYVEGRELAVSLLAGADGDVAGPADRRGGPPRPPVLRLRGPLRDRAAPISSARRSSTTSSRSACSEIGRAAWELLDCRGFARVDMILAPDGPTCSRSTRSRA